MKKLMYSYCITTSDNRWNIVWIVYSLCIYSDIMLTCVERLDHSFLPSLFHLKPMRIKNYQKSLSTIQKTRHDAIPVFVILSLHASTIPERDEYCGEETRRDLLTKEYLTAIMDRKDCYVWLLSREHSFWRDFFMQYGCGEVMATHHANRTAKAKDINEDFQSRDKLIAWTENPRETEIYCQRFWLEQQLLDPHIVK